MKESELPSLDEEEDRPEPRVVPLDFRDHPRPMVHELSAASDERDSRWQSYDCLPEHRLPGKEAIYSITLEQRGSLAAEIAVERGHNFALILARPRAKGRLECLNASQDRASAHDLAPGKYWVIVDGESPSDTTARYRLAVEPDYYDTWVDRPLDEGIVWSRYRSIRPAMMINLLRISAKALREDYRVHGVLADRRENECATIPTLGRRSGARLGINSSFHRRSLDGEASVPSCDPVTMVKIEGEILAVNEIAPSGQPTLGFDRLGQPHIDSIASDESWTRVQHANGGYPTLLPQEAFHPKPGTERELAPRSAAGLDAEGNLLLVVVDGRTRISKGMQLRELQSLMRELGATRALNFDGGGSSTLWIDGTTLSGVVNYPSDGWTAHEEADHRHSRAVSDGLMLFDRE